MIIKIVAKIKLYKNETSRKSAFTNGYRPLFNFIPEMKTSGQITLINSQNFSPGDEDLVEIIFGSADYLGSSFGTGTKFTFGEGRHALGEGEVIKII